MRPWVWVRAWMLTAFGVLLAGPLAGQRLAGCTEQTELRYHWPVGDRLFYEYREETEDPFGHPVSMGWDVAVRVRELGPDGVATLEWEVLSSKLSDGGGEWPGPIASGVRYVARVDDLGHVRELGGDLPVLELEDRTLAELVGAPASDLALGCVNWLVLPQTPIRAGDIWEVKVQSPLAEGHPLGMRICGRVAAITLESGGQVARLESKLYLPESKEALAADTLFDVAHGRVLSVQWRPQAVPEEARRRWTLQRVEPAPSTPGPLEQRPVGGEHQVK